MSTFRIATHLPPLPLRPQPRNLLGLCILRSEDFDSGGEGLIGGCIVGLNNKDVIVAIVERSTNYLMMRKLPFGKSPEELAKVVNKMLFAYRLQVLSITTDNGIEFAGHKAITKVIKAKVYFADPYASWQKGAVENANKLIRQYIPK